jgi:hypothetical protein
VREQQAPNFFEIYAIIKQKSKHNFSGEPVEREGFFCKSHSRSGI